MTGNKAIDNSWDFRTVNTKIGNHGFHTYPAMMIPQISRRLIEEYGSSAKILCDPFMGTGTSILEAKIHPNFEKAYGIDINPLARLVGKVKSTPIDISKLETAVEVLFKSISRYQDKSPNINTPQFKNIDYWFKPQVTEDLAIIKDCIENVHDADKKVEQDIKDFLYVAFSETVRLASNTRNSEFKLYRMAEKKLADYNPDTYKIFRDKLFSNLEKMKEFVKDASNCEICILDEDSREQTEIPPNSVDIIVSSPPYGDSKTTVAYGQFSRLSLEWLGFDSKEVRSIDKVSLGGIASKDLENDLGSPQLDNSLKIIGEIDKKRALEVLSFYEDFNLCAKEIDRFMKDGGYVCFVVGNRTVKKHQIPTDEIIVELFQNIGNYIHEKTIIRNIPSKRMPKKNSPSNVKGEISSTMNHEYIIILKKQLS